MVNSHLKRDLIQYNIIHHQNINTSRLCNGTKLSVKKKTNNIIKATVFNEKSKGNDVTVHPFNSDKYVIRIQTLRYPVRLVFAMKSSIVQR